MADALVALLKDRDLARRLARGGRERVARFSWEAAAERVESELLSLVR